MTRRVMAQVALSLSLLALAGLPVQAVTAPMPAVQTQAVAPRTPIVIGDQGPSLAELSYERLLEESLQQSLAAYLGADQFVLQVRVGMSSDAQAQAPMPAVQAPAAQPQALTAPDVPAEAPSDFDQIPALPGLGGVAADDRPKQRPVQQQAPAAPQPVSIQPQAPQSLPASEHIDRIRISLVLPSTLKSADEDYVKNLVFQKADLNFARGDTLDISRRDFPHEAVPLVPGGTPATPPVGGLPSWLWAVLGALGASAVFGALYLLRRKPAPAPVAVAPTAPALVPENTKAAEAILASLEAAKVAAEPVPMRQDLLVLLLENPESGERYVRKLFGEEGGLEKAVALTRAMGMNIAKRLFSGLLPQEWKAIELASLDHRDIKREDQMAVMEEAVYALLRDKSEKHGDKSTPFAFLNTLDDSQILYMLEDEGPRVQALVLSQLPPDRAVGLMRLKTPAEQGAIAAAMGELHLLPMSSFLDLAHHMAEKASKAPSFETAVANGLGLLVNLLDHSDRATEQGILSGLSSQNPRLLAQVREAYLTFDDLARVPRDVLKDALREADKESLAEALRDAPEAVRDAVVGSLTDRARRIVDEVLGQPPIGVVDPAKVEAVRKDLVGRVRQLMQLGRFNMKQVIIPQEDAR